MLVLFVEDLEELHCEATAEAGFFWCGNVFAARGSNFKGAVHARCKAEIQLTEMLYDAIPRLVEL